MKMVSTRAVLFVVLICVAGSLSGANSRRRQVRSPFSPELQSWVAKAAEEQVKLATKIGRAMKILPPKADNETVREENSTAVHDSNPFAIFGSIPLKIVSVVKGARDEKNKTIEVEEVKPIVEETTQAAVTLPVQVIEVKADPVERLPKPLELRSSDVDSSKTVEDEASTVPTLPAALKIRAVTVPASVTSETDSAAAKTDSVAEIDPIAEGIDPVTDGSDGSDASAHGPVPRAVADIDNAEETEAEETEAEEPEAESSEEVVVSGKAKVVEDEPL